MIFWLVLTAFAFNSTNYIHLANVIYNAPNEVAGWFLDGSSAKLDSKFIILFIIFFKATVAAFVIDVAKEDSSARLLIDGALSFIIGITFIFLLVLFKLPAIVSSLVGSASLEGVFTGGIRLFNRVATLAKESETARNLDFNFLLNAAKATIDVILFFEKTYLKQIFYDPYLTHLAKRSLVG